MSLKALLAMSTAKSRKEGKKIAQRLVELKLAACVNVIPQVNSFYFWAGKLCQDNEVIIIIKTENGQKNKIIKEIKRINTYEVPEIIFFKIDEGEERYLNWIKKTLEKNKKSVRNF